MDKITRVRELAKIIDDAEAELNELLGETQKPKRGRPRNSANKETPDPRQLEIPGQ